MELAYYTGWEVVSYIQLVIFVIFLIEFAISIIYKLKRRKELKPILPFFFLFTMFIMFKIIGAILSLVFMHQSKFNLSLFIPTYIFDTISLGFITRSISSLLQHMLNQHNAADPESFSHFPKSPLNQFSSSRFKTTDIETSKEVDQKNFAKKFWPFKLVTMLLLAAVILSVVGTSQATETNPPSTVESLLKASSILFLVGVLIMIALLAFILASGTQFDVVAKLLTVALVILIIRCSYSIATVFAGFNFENPYKYMILFGDYKYYTFLGLLTEALASICVLVSFWYW